MKSTYQRLLFSFATLLLLFSSACRHVTTKPLRTVESGQRSLTNRDVSMVLVPEKQSTPAYILFEQKDRYAFGSILQTSGYKLEMAIDPLMRNFSMVAKISKNGKILREYVAKKNASSVLSDKKTTWSPARSRMVIAIPYLDEGEEVLLTTSYEWMDVRWLPPIMLQEDGLGAHSTLTLDVAYGVTMHFKATKDKNGYDFIPESFPHENKLWVEQDNQAGLGLRYIWQSLPEQQSKSAIKADLLQMYLAFDSPARNENFLRFDNWSTVASYLYDRIDRYDLASSEIRDFSSAKTKNMGSEQEKIDWVFSFLKNEIERRQALGAYNEQPVQPATRTFARKFGSAFDIVILGKAMLATIGIDANIVLASDRRFNPRITDFFSPALFSSVVLTAKSTKGTHYFDPEADKGPSELGKHLQGQCALELKPQKGDFFSLPYDGAQKHGQTQTYQLWLNDDGALVGEYSIDLLGFDATSLGAYVPGPTDASSLESKLRTSSELPFSLSSAELISNGSAAQALRFFGEIKPSLLVKNGNNFELALEKIIAPVVAAVKSAKLRGYSFTSKLALLISLPDGMSVKNLPANINLTSEGIEGRFSISSTGPELMMEGIAMVSLPVIASDEKLTESFNRLKTFGEHRMIIDGETLTGAPDVAETFISKNP